MHTEILREILMKKITFLVVSGLIMLTSLEAKTLVINGGPNPEELLDEPPQSRKPSRQSQLNQPQKSYDQFIAAGAFYSQDLLRDFSFTKIPGSTVLYSPNIFRPRSLNLALQYHWKISPLISVGVLYQKHHHCARSLTLKENSVGSNISYSTTPAVPLKKYSSNGENFIAFFRQHLLPQASLEPFLEIGLGLALQTGTLIDENDAHYHHTTIQPFINSIGVGVHKQLHDPLAVEGVLSFRNQKSIKFHVKNLVEGQTSQYYGFDARLMLVYGW